MHSGTTKDKYHLQKLYSTNEKGSEEKKEAYQLGTRTTLAYEKQWDFQDSKPNAEASQIIYLFA